MSVSEEYPQHPVYDKNTIEFVTVAAEYCSFIERCGGMGERVFLDKMSKLLPLLYLKMSLVPDMDTCSISDLTTYVSERQYDAVRAQIQAIVGEHDEYLEVFQEDMKYSDTPIVASISENLADVRQLPVGGPRHHERLADYLRRRIQELLGTIGAQCAEGHS